MGKKDAKTEERSLLTLKPHMFNAIIPMFLRNLIYSFIINIGIYGLVYLAVSAGMMSFFPEFDSIWFYILFSATTAGLAFLPLLWKIIVLYNTKYYFFRNRVLREFEFLVIRKQSVMYDKIVDLTIDISIWDRLCGSGDITLHTAENRSPDLKLLYIKKPQMIEKSIYQIISRGSHKHESNIHRKAYMHSPDSPSRYGNGHPGNVPEQDSSGKK